MLQQDINRAIFEFTATQSFHCRYININMAKFKNSKWQKQKVMWPKWWNILVTWLNENWNRVWNFLWRCWQFSDFRNIGKVQVLNCNLKCTIIACAVDRFIIPDRNGEFFYFILSILITNKNIFMFFNPCFIWNALQY